jgi:succinyl-CoA synthetase beta subunit
MDTYEYQAKQILREYGIPAPDIAVVSTVEEAKRIVEQQDLDQGVLKVQVHAGGRGKAGGIKLARTRDEILLYTKQLLGMKIVNNQTGPKGVVVHRVLISPLIEVKKEFYMGAVIDRQRARAMLIISSEGGMDIEEVAAKTPHKILTVPICSDGTIRDYNLLRMVNFMKWNPDQAQQGKAIAQRLAKAFIQIDASLIEINPLVETSLGDFIALDAKLSVDDNALFRQPQIASFYDPSELTTQEAKAREYDLAYVALDGNIGCMVNGAGLAMATMDIIYLHGGAPANFLDVGGGASEEKVAAGFKIILEDPKVKAILVNIFGGIMNCETLAAGIIAAAGKSKLKIPLIVRMEGTNVEKGKKLLAESKLNIIIALNLAEAAQKAVEAAR